MNDKHSLILGFDIGGTKSTALVGTSTGGVLDRIQFASKPERGPDAMIADLVDAAAKLFDRHRDIQRIGVSIGGPLDAERGIIHSPPNLPGWDNVPLATILQGKSNLPVSVHHDAAACALAEYLWGAGQGKQSIAYLTCGTGFGVGIILNGKPHYGTGGSGCEIGHVRYRDTGPTAFGKVGCYEAYASGTALSGLAAYLYPSRWGDHRPAPAQIGELAANGDEQAMHIVSENAQAVGSACALLADLLFPQLILLGSLATYLGPRWITMVRDTYTKAALDRASAACPILPAALGARLQDCSAIAAALVPVNSPS